MKIIEKTFTKDMNTNFNLMDEKVCFLDIETTGLNRSIDSIYLIGLVYYDNSIQGWKIIQLFAEELKEEVDILLEAYKMISSFDTIINYNGTSFDIPFINSKLKFYRTNLLIDMDKSLDLYRIIQSNKYLLDLKNYKLKTIESFLGIHREDTFTGRECIDFYFDYLITKNVESKDHILQHNYEDLYYLLDVVKIVDILNHKKSFIINYRDSTNHFLIADIDLKKDYLFIRGKINNNTIRNTIYFTDNYKIIITRDNTFEVSLEVKEGLVTPTTGCTFINAISFDLPNKAYWSDQFKVPKGIILLSVEKNYYMENIKLVMSSLINMIIR